MFMSDNKKIITISSIVALVILAIVIIITLINGLVGFGLILGALFLILTICLGIYLREDPDEYSTYIKNKKKILKTYNSIIVEVEDIPNIAGKNIIKVKSIEDLVDAQLELREPIYYKNDSDSSFFMLLHYNEACIYILRMNENVVSPTEQSIKYMKEDTEEKSKDQENILENIEDTIVYKLDELRSFKISPIRNKEKIKVVDDTAIKDEIEKGNNYVVEKDLENEMTKTLYLKDLKKKMQEMEEAEEQAILEEQKAAKKKENEVKLSLDVSKKEAKSIAKKKEKLQKSKAKATAKKTTAIKKANTHSSRRASSYKKKNTK
jgi:hypothetical protein